MYPGVAGGIYELFFNVSQDYANAHAVKFWCHICILKGMHMVTDYGGTMRKFPSLYDRKSTPTPKFLGTAEAYFVCHIGPNFQIYLIYAFIRCP